MNINEQLGYDPNDVGNGCYTERWEPVSFDELQARIAGLKRKFPGLPDPEVLPNPVMGDHPTVAGGKFLPLNVRFTMKNEDGSDHSETYDATQLVRMAEVNAVEIKNAFFA